MLVNSATGIFNLVVLYGICLLDSLIKKEG